MINWSVIFFSGFSAAIIASLLFGIKEILNKQLTKRLKLPILTALIGGTFFTSAFIIILTFLTQQFTTNLTTLLFALWGSIILSLGTFLHLKSVTIEDFSLTLPFLSFSFCFLIPLEYIFYGQLPTLLAIFGLIAIIMGTFWLGFIESIQTNIWWQIKKGSRQMIIVAFLYSLAANIDKAGSLSYSPLGYLAWSYLFIFIIYFIFSLLVSKKLSTHKILFADLKENWQLFVILGLISCVAAWFLLSAYTVILVNYAIAIKRAGLLIPIILGPLFFKEKNLVKRLPGVLLMLLGALIIILFG